MKKYTNNTKGFTLIETVVAILILSLTVGALLTLTANSIFSVRYARNQIVANNLAQEALEFIRNSRDSRLKDTSATWAEWLQSLNVDYRGNPFPLATPHGCFLTGTNQGCIVDPYTDINSNALIWEETYPGTCTNSGTTSCPYLWYYPSSGFYTYSSRYHSAVLASGTPLKTTYLRTVNAILSPDQNQLTVTVTVQWNNGVTPKTLTQSMALTNWSE